MNRKQINRLSLGLGIMRRIGQILIVVGFIGAVGVVGTSDLEAEIGEILHPNSWYTTMTLIYLAVITLGYFLASIAKPIYKKIRKINFFYELGVLLYYNMEDFDDGSQIDNK